MYVKYVTSEEQLEAGEMHWSGTISGPSFKASRKPFPVPILL